VTWVMGLGAFASILNQLGPAWIKPCHWPTKISSLFAPSSLSSLLAASWGRGEGNV